jgi:type II secretory pathway component GspD/PulD (secretin)
MRRRFEMVKQFRGLIVALLIAAVASGLICSVGFAAGKDEKISIDLKDVDVRTAIEALFSGTGINYAVDSQVSGVTIASFSVKDTPFEVALKTLVKTAGLVYRVDNGIYIISKKVETTDMNRPVDTTPVDAPQVDTTTTAESIIDKIPLSNTGATELLNMMNGNTNSSSGYGSSGGMGGMSGMSGMSGFGGSSSGFGNSGSSGFGSSGSSGFGSRSGSSSWGSSSGSRSSW